ncbi:spore germination protein [Ammoniphilus sp. YIM 78166]|uniref:spore germination protein n=1 Tax=Ammoniphilus sp. YIM 78166 TaxID=1644106 RepID=UPI00106FFC50|nr:spore germination protein [Ammoniphilus sp. YIM 78166]
MFINHWFSKNENKKQDIDTLNLDNLFTKTKKSSDFKQFSLSNEEGSFILSYYNSLIDQQQLQCKILQVFQDRSLDRGNLKKIDDVREFIPIEDIIITDNLDVIQSKLLKGYAILQIKENDPRCALIHLSNEVGLRDKNDVENEFTVVGPKVGFVENIEINIHLLRQQINTPNLIFKEMTIGTMSHTKVVIAYIEGITNDQHVQTMVQRLENIDFDIVFDSSQLHQFIADNSSTPFPLALSTERADRVVWSMLNGQVAVLSSGSPYAITAPSTLLEFFITPEDYYLPWIVSSFFRLTRIIGVLFSIFATSIYIAVLTYHYEMIPEVLLGPLSLSRRNVPFSPVLEVLFLEFTIELLREAGARLPAKVGQTLGIVGGIVIGQASVEAALTSNVLLIIVALSALASFNTPIYKMSNTIRFLRFPLILFAALWGGLGIVLGFSFLLVHLLRLESLGSPYMVPLYPFRPKDFADSFIRSPYSVTTKRPGYLRPKSIWRYHPNDHKKKKNDFDD